MSGFEDFDDLAGFGAFDGPDNSHSSIRSSAEIRGNFSAFSSSGGIGSIDYIYTYLHTFSGPLFGTTQMTQYQKGKTNLDFTEARDSEWQWHQLGRMKVCTSLQTDNHASTPPLSFFTGQMPFPSPNQQRQSTEGR